MEVLDIDDNMDGSYSVTGRPQREGPHQLWLLLNGEHVRGSPAALHVEACEPH